MPHMSKSRLLATSAIAGLSFLHLTSPAAAQTSFGIHNEQPDLLTVTVAAGEVVEGEDSGIYADNGPVDVDNSGTIRGNGTIFGNAETRPSAGIVIAQPGSTIVNSGEISGGATGITTSYFFSEDANGENLPPQPLATDTSVINSGLIRGDAGAGVGLYGGGDVTNSGTIRALTGTVGNGAQAIGVFIGEFPDAIAADATGVGSITNTASGLIEGQLYGATLQGGGTIDNAGIIRSTGAFNPATPSTPPVGLVVGATEAQTGRSATVNNSGTIGGFIGMAVSAFLDDVTINNDGLISGNQIGITSGGSMTINNGADGRILGANFAINSSGGVLTLDNEGLIRSTGQAAVNIAGADGTVTNSGTIEGVFGITTNPIQISPGVSEFRAINTAVDNSGSIIGTNNDGVRLQGGGSVTNSGNIEGLLNAQADGVSIFHVDGQGLDTYAASLTNTATGTISGNRFGAIISSGGEIDNEGSITGRAGGAVIQNGLADPGITGSLTNSGTITGTEGMGVGFNGLEAADLSNSGTITGLAGDGVYVVNPRGTTATIDNSADGEITGSESGIHVELGGLTLTNAGTIRGNGANPGFDAPPDAGVTMSGGPSSVVNSGTITGTGFGVTTASYFNPETGELEYLAENSSVVNTGTIIGEFDDGVRLIGGGSVTNNGIIYGQIAEFADGISMFAYTQQPNEGYSALVTNEAAGEIVGNRFGIILSGGGTVENAGSIAGGVGGLFIQGTALNTDPGEDRSGLTASVVNSGTIRGLSLNGSSGGDGYGVGFGSDMSAATLENSGDIISDTGAGVSSGTRADVTVTNLAGGTITGGTSGIYSFATGTIDVVNAGTIRGNGTYDGFAAAPDAGVTISTASSSVTNSGTISGAGAGITTAMQFDESINALVGLAVGTAVVNSGTIIGETNDGVRLIGGGSVTNSGLIEAQAGDFSDGISMYAHTDQANENYGALVTNETTGEIRGSRFGIILSGGGDVANAGDITGVTGGLFIQGTALNTTPGEDRSGLTASVVNSGTISGTGNLGGSGGQGYGVSFGSDMSTASLENSGAISSAFGAGVSAGTLADVTVTNVAGGAITGGTSGIYSFGGGTLAVVNAGEIRGGGAYDGFDAPPDAGVTITTAASSVVNSGTISGAGAGITTAMQFDEDIGTLVGIAVGTTVENSGAITGESNDGVRLIGGGSVTNSGEISGAGAPFADGISMFRYDAQGPAGYSASVANSAAGTIAGDRFGIILSGGGAVNNAGAIEGGLGGLLIQSQFDGEDAGLTGTLTNSGTITGGIEAGVQFSAGLASASVDNSGTISGGTAGVGHGSDGTLSLVNTGTITGGTSGVLGDGGGALTVDNGGTIRGNGTNDAANRVDAGISIGQPGSTITNSGTISGAGAGISTFSALNPATGQNVAQTFGTEITNSGDIIGDNNDGIRLFGGGTISNSGTIEGKIAFAADGIQINSFGGQDPATYQAVIDNSADGTIRGVRYGVIALGGGGSVTNAGEIGGLIGGVLLQGNSNTSLPPSNASVANSGTIVATQGLGVGFITNLATASLENSGAISGATGVRLAATASTVDNAVGGSISGVDVGVFNSAGSLTLTNAGSITASTGPGVISAGQTILDNSGTIGGGSGIAVQLGAFDDIVTLRTGSAISGAIDASDGVDRLFLEGDVLELTAAQQLTAATGFEELTVGSGYWSTSGAVGAFDNVVIDAGATLRVNEVNGPDGPESPILTPAVANAGLLVLNFGDDETVSDLDALSITGAGRLQLIGDAVFTVDTDTIAHTGGTTISNGGLVLTGLLQGNVVTEGDGYFELGAGGTEGSFAGDIVNNGRFVFNRSDDYDFLGAFSGSGTLDKMGAGVLTFMGDYNFQGVTNIFGGLVRIGGIIDPETEFNLGDGGTLDITGQDQTIAGLAGEQNATVNLGDSNLTVNQQQNSEFAGTIEGEGGFTKSGSGTLNLTGDSSYTGPTVVDEGRLAVNGSIVSPVTVNEGASLGGNGSVGSTTVGSGGSIAPGNSIGRLTVNGDLAFTAGSIYEVEVNAAGQADRIDATGAVTIASTARVDVLAEQGNYNPRTDYIILTGAGGITGTFGSVTSDLAFLDPVLRYSLNTVTLSLYRNDVDFTDVASGFNQIGVAAAIQARGINDPIFEAVLPLNAAGAQAAFADLSGEVLASSISGLTDDSRHLRNAILGMQTPEAEGLFVWGSGFGGWGDFDAGANSAGLDTDHKGFVTGFGYGGNGFGAAISAGIGSSDFDLAGRGDRAKADSKYLAAHLGYGAGEGFRGSLGISFAWHDIDSNRSVSIAPIAQSLTSSRDADTLQLFGELGYGLTMGKAALTPFARLAHVRTKSDAFVEAGGNAALAVAKAQQETTFISLGLQARFNAGQPGLQPFASLAWNNASGDRGAPVTAAFASGGPAFGLIGTLIPKNSAEVEAGLDYSSGPVRIGAAYSGALASGRSSHGVRLTARIVF